MNVIGAGTEPVAKSLTLVILVPVLIAYSVAVSVIPSSKHLVCAVCAIYTLLYLAIAVELLSDGKNPARWAVWLLYYATETRAVIIMPMIWSVINDLSSP